MDVFGVRDQLIGDYREYTRSFVDIRDSRIREHIDDRIASGYQWPDPWLSLNPNFAPGGSITDLISDGLLHEDCARIFRLPGQAGQPDGGQPPRRAGSPAYTGEDPLLFNQPGHLVPGRQVTKQIKEFVGSRKYVGVSQLPEFRSMHLREGCPSSPPSRYCRDRARHLVSRTG